MCALCCVRLGKGAFIKYFDGGAGENGGGPKKF